MVAEIYAVLLLCGLLVLVNSQEEVGGKRVLVVMENGEIRSTHSIFFKSLEGLCNVENTKIVDRGYELDYVTSESKDINFRKYGEWQYDNLILFAPSIEGKLNSIVRVLSIFNIDVV